MTRTYVVKKALTRELLKLSDAHPVHFTIDSAMRLGSAQEQPDAKGQKKEPPWLCEVTDLDEPNERLAMKELILPAQLRSKLNEGYPDDAYVGLSFEVQITGEKKGKNGTYHTMRLDEVEVG